MATPNIVPRADSEGGLGTASKYWGSAYIDNVFVSKIGRDADNLLDFSTDNKIKFRVGATNELNLDNNALYPESNDGVGLGYNTNAWSNLFLADGAVINFNDGNVTLTHSSNVLTLADSDKLCFGTSSDLQIYHNSTDSIISDHGPGDLIIQQTSTGKDIIFKSDDGSSNETAYLTIDGGGVLTRVHQKLRADDNVNIELGASGGMHLKHTGSASNITNHVGDLTIQNDTNDGDIIFQASTGSATAATYLTLDGSVGRTKFDKHLQANDTVKIFLGTGLDFEMYHNASNTLLQNNAGDLGIINMKQNKDILFQADDGQASDDTVATYFYLDGSSAEHNGSATTALYTNWPDNSRISVGTSHDLQLDHNSTDSILRNLTGDLYIMNKADDKDVIFQASTGSAAAETYFYLDGSIDANRFPKNVLWDDNVKALFGGGSGDLQIYHNTSNSFIENTTGDLYIKTTGILRLNSSSNESMITAAKDGAVELFYDNSKKFETTSAGVQVEDTVSIKRSGVAAACTLQQTGSGLELNQHSGYHPLILKENGVEVARIANTGDATFASSVKINSNYTANTDANDLQIGSATTGNGGLSIITGNSNTGGIYFADQDNNDAGRIKYIHSSNALLFDTNRANALTIDSSQNATFAGSVTASQGITQPVASAAANVATAVAGSIYNFSDDDGAVVILPDSGDGSQVGKTFEFIVLESATSNSHKVVCADTTNEKIIGQLSMIDVDTSSTETIQVSSFGSNISSINLNGTTTGAFGSRFRITNVANDIWMVEGNIHHTGNVATPFATS